MNDHSRMIPIFEGAGHIGKIHVIRSSVFNDIGCPMRITNIGTIVDIRRIAGMIDEYGEKFLSRIYCDEERTQKTGEGAMAHYAKRFAAKEAISKALGTGIGETNFKHIKILNHESGQPYAVVEGFKGKVHLSLSDDYPYAVAYAIIEE